MEAWGARLLAALSLGPAAAACGGTEETATNQFSCESPEPVTAVGSESGYVRCDNGMLHRPVAKECASTLPRAEQCTFDIEGGDCTTDADCTEKAHGHCSTGIQAPCSCQYGCVQDSDCALGQICMCGDPVGHCVSASCSTDADCEGGLCASFVSEPGCGGTVFACQTPQDECGGDGDCAQGEQCTLRNGKRVCEEINCAIGRPFLVAGSERLADSAPRSDWRDVSLAPAVDHLDAPTRARLAEQWTRAALMEHASIAAFARFALQLLASGAPPELVSAASDAMADETAHARACFALAGAYAGAPIGPGRLSIERALEESDERACIVQAILEGCIGETVAAIEAAECAAHASDPIVAALLERIAADETRHAELAWRYVAWALDRGGAEIAQVVRSTFEGCGEHGRGDVSTAPADLSHGVMGDAARRALRRRVLVEVVGPCARALLVVGKTDTLSARASA